MSLTSAVAYFPIRHLRISMVAGLALVSSTVIAAPAPSKGTKSPLTNAGNAAPARMVDTSDILQVALRTSRREVSIDGAYGVFADIKNISASPVSLFTQEIVLVVEPEVTYSTTCSFSVDGFFPTENAPSVQPSLHETVAPKQAEHVSGRGFEIQIQPNERYTVFWDVNKRNTNVTESTSASTPAGGADPCQADRHWWDSIGFVPGEYVFTVDGKAYPGDDPSRVPTYHTFTQSTTLKVSISQTTALFAAAIGAVLAALMMALRVDGAVDRLIAASTWPRRIGAAIVLVRDLTSAALLGAVITIVASRLADTQFPIKVSVNDVWGAMAIGFASYFAGNKLIDKLVTSLGGSR